MSYCGSDSDLCIVSHVHSNIPSNCSLNGKQSCQPIDQDNTLKRKFRDPMKVLNVFERIFSDRNRHLTDPPLKKVVKRSELETNDDQWPFSKMYSIREVITFNGVTFEFDRTFLDNLKKLKSELSIYGTKESKKKSRAFGLEVISDEIITNEELLLIDKIRINIEKVKCFIEETELRLKEKELKKRNKKKRKDHKTKTSVEKETQFRQVLPTVLQDQVDNEEIIVVRDNVPIFMQQYMDSLGKTEYRFSRDDMKIALGVLDRDDRDDRDADNTQDSEYMCSQFSSQNTDMSDDIIILKEPFPRRTPTQYDLIENWAQTGNYYIKAEDPDAETQVCQQSGEPSTQQLSQTSLYSQETIQRSQQIEIVNRHKWTNTHFNISTGVTLKDEPQNKVRTQLKRHKQIQFVLEKILGLIESKCFCTKRDLYYQNVMLFDKSQRVVDEIIDDLACSLRASRTRLHIVSSTRGLVFGHLKFQNTNGVETDCLSSPNGINIPNDTSKLSRFRSKALFVLIIEKDATFQQLIDLNIHKKYPIIMITGHGYPDMNTRAFVQILWNTFEIPIFGLVDGDAHGLEILCTFKHGSLALSYESENLVVPAIKWIGILPTDILAFKLSKNVLIPLNDSDRKKIQDLKQRNYMVGNQVWTKQLDILLKIGYKVEIQSLAEHNPSFLFNTYLPNKLRYGKWF